MEKQQKTPIRYEFSTPIGYYRLPDYQSVNRGLTRIIRSRQQTEEGMTRSNVGGWHSDDTFFSWQGASPKRLAEFISKSILNITKETTTLEKFDCKFKLSGWANINGPGEYNALHDHPASAWSGVYYVKVNDEERDPLPRAGRLSIVDPRGPINMTGQCKWLSHNGGAMTIRPLPGLCVIFPSWLRHNVMPFTLDQIRISIAFNCELELRPA